MTHGEPPVAPSVDKSSVIEDLVDVLFSPKAVFSRRAGQSLWSAYFIVTALLAIAVYVSLGAMQGVMDAEMARAMADLARDQPNMTGEQLENVRSTMEKGFAIGPMLFMPVVLLLLGLCVWLVGKIFGGELSYGTGVMIASLSYLPKVFEAVLVIVQSMVMDTSAYTGRYQFSFGVGRFVDPGGAQGIYNLIGRLDLFTLWTTALIAIGLVYAAKVDKSKAYVAAAVMWALGAAPALLQLAQGK